MNPVLSACPDRSCYHVCCSASTASRRDWFRHPGHAGVKLHHLKHHPAVQVACVAMLSLTAVFRDIAPGYAVRLPTDKELEMAVSKDVRATRDFESSLLRAYQVSCMKCALSDSAVFEELQG